MERKGCIYTEIHNHGRKHSSSESGNRSGVQLVKGVGLVRMPGYRWVAEISYKGHRYRCRSYHYNTVRTWLDQMIDRFSDKLYEFPKYKDPAQVGDNRQGAIPVPDA